MKHLRFICQVPRCLLPYRQQTFLACFQMYSTSIKRHIKDVTDFCLNENDYEATIDNDLCSKWIYKFEVDLMRAKIQSTNLKHIAIGQVRCCKNLVRLPRCGSIFSSLPINLVHLVPISISIGVCDYILCICMTKQLKHHEASTKQSRYKIRLQPRTLPRSLFKWIIIKKHLKLFEINRRLFSKSLS